MGIEVLIPIFGVMVVLVPITGLTVIMMLRLGGKPFIETLARELRASGFTNSSENRAKMEDLMEQVEVLTSEVHRLKNAQLFDQKLLEAQPTASEDG